MDVDHLGDGCASVSTPFVGSVPLAVNVMVIVKGGNESTPLLPQTAHCPVIDMSKFWTLFGGDAGQVPGTIWLKEFTAHFPAQAREALALTEPRVRSTPQVLITCPNALATFVFMRANDALMVMQSLPGITCGTVP